MRGDCERWRGASKPPAPNYNCPVEKHGLGTASPAPTRGPAVALGDDPSVLRVRLGGPPERRLRQAMMIEGIGEQAVMPIEACVELFALAAYAIATA